MTTRAVLQPSQAESTNTVLGGEGWHTLKFRLGQLPPFSALAKTVNFVQEVSSVTAGVTGL